MSLCSTTFTHDHSNFSWKNMSRLTLFQCVQKKVFFSGDGIRSSSAPLNWLLPGPGGLVIPSSALCNVSRLQQGATTVPRSVRLTSTSAAVTYLSLLPTVWSDQYLCIVMLRPTPDPPDTLFSHITAVLKTTLNIYRLGTLLHWTILNSPPTVLPPRHPLYLPLPSPFPMPLWDNFWENIGNSETTLGQLWDNFGTT